MSTCWVHIAWIKDDVFVWTEVLQLLEGMRRDNDWWTLGKKMKAAVRYDLIQTKENT